MYKTKLLEFIVSGTIGGIGRNSRAHEVVKILGPPERKGGGSRKYPRPNLWRYGNIEIGFVTGSDCVYYVAILTSDFGSLSGGRTIKLECDGIYQSMPKEEFVAILEENEITYQEQPGFNPGCTDIIVDKVRCCLNDQNRLVKIITIVRRSS